MIFYFAGRQSKIFNQIFQNLQTQNEGSSNQSLKIPLHSLLGSKARSLCILYCCSHLHPGRQSISWCSYLKKNYAIQALCSMSRNKKLRGCTLCKRILTCTFPYARIVRMDRYSTVPVFVAWYC